MKRLVNISGHELLDNNQYHAFIFNQFYILQCLFATKRVYTFDYKLQKKKFIGNNLKHISVFELFSTMIFNRSIVFNFDEEIDLKVHIL